MTTATTLGRLQRIALHEVWTKEASEFTPWLGQAENLALLGETLGLDLDLERQEQEVGRFRADLLCKSTLDGSWVLIENQIARTDHTHLGQILTYAAGLEAATIVWVAERFCEEHRAALDWLNEITSDQYCFFGVEVELWRIADSAPAPRFNVVSKPNDWSRNVRAATSEHVLPAGRLQLRYWQAFSEFMRGRSRLRCQSPAAQNWMNHSIGVTGAYLNSIASADGENRVQLYLDGRSAKARFACLERSRDEIEAEAGLPLTWFNAEGTKSARIFVARRVDINDESDWLRQFEWLRANLELFGRVFGPRVRALRDSERQGTQR